jgi:hypothetical protein
MEFLPGEIGEPDFIETADLGSLIGEFGEFTLL